MEIAEVLIIGGGVIGSSIAYHVARRRHRVIVVERATPGVAPSASWASAGGVRRQGRRSAEVPLAIEAIERWPTLEDELAADLHYRQDGNLRLAESDAETEAMAVFVQRQQRNGLSDVRLVDRSEALALVPGLNDKVTAGSFSPSDGHANASLTALAFARAAERHAATYWNGVQAVSLVTRGERVVGARTTAGEIGADTVVLAAGAWSDELAATAGLCLPIRTRALQMLLSTPAPAGVLKPVIGALGRSLSLKQLPTGEFFLGGGWLGDPTPDRSGYTLRPESEEGNWEAARGLLPAVGAQQVARKWCGLEAESFDGLPLIGFAPGFDGLVLALGFSGHGFAISPAVGRSVADLLLRNPAPELDGLAPARMATFDPGAVARFTAEPPTYRVLAG